MKKIRFILFVMFFTCRLLAVGQLKTDSVQLIDSPSNTLTPKELRKEKDSIVKNLMPISDKAIVYIIRNYILDILVPYRLDCDSFQLGWVKSGNYLYTILDPGDHIFISLDPPGDEFHLKMKLEPGKIYYLELYPAIGILGSTVKMKLLNADKGRKYLMTCNISKHNQYPLFPKSKEVENFPPDDK